LLEQFNSLTYTRGLTVNFNGHIKTTQQQTMIQQLYRKTAHSLSKVV